MQTATSLQEFGKHQPRRYQQVPRILKDLASQTARAIVWECGAGNPKIREVAVEVDFKGTSPIATVRSRYFGKWAKTAEFQIGPRDGLNFTPFVAGR